MARQDMRTARRSTREPLIAFEGDTNVMKTRRRWTETAIETEVAPIVAELGRMPTRRELADRGVGGAWSAMQRHGGLRSWRARLSRPVVAQRAYLIAQERGGGDPVANWLAAERELLAA